MTPRAQTPDDNPARLPNLVMALCLVATIGALAAIVRSAPDIPDVTEQSFVLHTPHVDAERLADDRARHYPQTDLTPAAAEIDTLMESVKKANEMQFGQPDGKAIHDTQVVMLHQANEVITKIGIASFVPAGQKMFDECRTSFDRLMKAVQAGTISSDTAAKDPGDAFDDYRSWCGNAYSSLLKSGVVTDKGTWGDPQSGPLVFDIMNRFRWAVVLDLRKPPWEQLSPYEYEVLTRWRVAITSVPVERRVEWVVSAAKALPQLPAEELIGDLLLENGDAVGALGSYNEACKKHPGDLLLTRKCEFLRERVPAQHHE